MTEHHRTGRAPNPTLFDHMGGMSGVVYTGLPIVTFVVANTIAGLQVAIAIAIGAEERVAVEQ